MTAHKVCPWWLGYFLASPLRRLLQNPEKIIAPYLQPGMRVLEPGPGMGFFTIPAARLVGDKGRVFTVDVQPKMLRELQHRAEKAGLGSRIETRLVESESMPLADLAASIDFALVFAVAHEVPDVLNFFKQISATLKPGANILFVEPAGHVSENAFSEEVAAAGNAGLRHVASPDVRGHSALLQKMVREEFATGNAR
ncbi:MAG TPA: methyltransferase domain-containing protein [Candidatus Acidoferrales bacterium]|nr:methyltransferase domain-containing protein [Candidatus Acidoferrales bacterium]